MLNSQHGPDSWHIHRSVEVLAYHREQKTVRILVMLQAENLLDGPNELCVLHRGSIQATYRRAWPMPDHPDEVMTKHKRNILTKLYSGDFEEHEGGVYQRQRRTAGDSIVPINPVPVQVWSPDGQPADDGDVLKAEFCSDECGLTCPFTTWRLTGFSEKALYLVAIGLEFSTSTYDMLLESQEAFTIDGPSVLLSRIRYYDLATLPPDSRANHELALEAFAGPNRLDPRTYGIIVLGSPAASDVEPDKTAPTSAVINARRIRGAMHFLAANPAFTLGLKYKAAGKKASQSVQCLPA